MGVVEPSGDPTLRKGRDDYECGAKKCLCGGTIVAGMVHVVVHGYEPAKDHRGVRMTHKRSNHFSIRYHVPCFFVGGRTDDKLSWGDCKLSELGQFASYGALAAYELRRLHIDPAVWDG